MSVSSRRRPAAPTSGEGGRAATTEVERFVVEAGLMLYPAVVIADRPDKDDGEWFVDVEMSGMHVPLSYQVGRGWGLYAVGAAYGDRPTEIYEESAVLLQRVRERLE